MYPNFFSGKTAVVLGASARGGTGFATAKSLVDAGAKVLIGARREDVLNEIAKEIGAEAMVCDASDPNQIAEFANKAADLYGNIDFAINCAGLSVQATISSVTLEQVQDSLNVNYISNVFFVKHMAEIMNDGGAITLISSTGVDRPLVSIFAYVAPKAATECLVRYAALELADRAIRVNAVVPGVIDSEMISEITAIPGVREAFEREIPLGRLGRPQEVADVILNLFSSTFVTGVCLPVSGGNQMTRLPTLL